MSCEDDAGPPAAHYRRPMPVLILRCPDCGHEFRSLVMEGAKVPKVWTCAECGGRRAEPHGTEVGRHPFAGGASCGCCG
jgi:hypothetical protein